MKRLCKTVLLPMNIGIAVLSPLSAGAVTREEMRTLDVGYPDGGGVRPDAFRVTAIIDGVPKLPISVSATKAAICLRDNLVKQHNKNITNIYFSISSEGDFKINYKYDE